MGKNFVLGDTPEEDYTFEAYTLDNGVCTQTLSNLWLEIRTYAADNRNVWCLMHKKFGVVGSGFLTSPNLSEAVNQLKSFISTTLDDINTNAEKFVH